VLTGEDIPGAAHVSSELINLVDVLDDGAREVLIAQVADDELVGGRIGVFVSFEVHRSDPKVLSFEAFNQVAADKAAGAVNKDVFCHIVKVAQMARLPAAEVA